MLSSFSVISTDKTRVFLPKVNEKSKFNLLNDHDKYITRGIEFYKLQLIRQIYSNKLSLFNLSKLVSKFIHRKRPTRSANLGQYLMAILAISRDQLSSKSVVEESTSKTQKMVNQRVLLVSFQIVKSSKRCPSILIICESQVNA